MTELQQKIEALIFFKNEPVSYEWLSTQLGIDSSEVQSAVATMKDFYDNRGIVLIATPDEVSLMTASPATELIQSLTKNEKGRELSKQALETLAIILYKGQVTKSEIDYIRGVNSVFILRNLLIRGLVAKKKNDDDKRAPYYVPTTDTLSFLGLQTLQDLPDFERIQNEIQKVEDQFNLDNKNESLDDIHSEDEL